MEIAFTKMHGAGNDFVVIDARATALALSPAQIVRVADRHLGIGCDQLILLHPASDASDAFVRFFNRDGSEVGACGNGTRCAAMLVAGGASREVRLRSIAGELHAEILADGQVCVDLGVPGLGWQEIPLSSETDTLHLGIERDPAACSMGNPHATTFVADLDIIDPAEIGSRLERHPLFAQGANIGFAQIRSASSMRLAVWERGSGLTLACGSGACAALVNAHRRGLVGRECTIDMAGGRLGVLWREDGHVLLTGPSEIAFTGSVRLDGDHAA